MKVIFQPTGKIENYERTMANGFNLEELKEKNLLKENQFEKLNSLSNNGTVNIWGITNGDKNRNKKKFESLKNNDLVFFYKDKMLYAYGEIAYTFENEELSIYLWGKKIVKRIDKSKKSEKILHFTWKNIYILKNFKTLDNPLSIEEVNAILDYEENNYVQGFTILDKNRSVLFLDYFKDDLATNLVKIPANKFNESQKSSNQLSKKEKYKRKMEVLVKSGKGTDRKSVVKRRGEQHLLRNYMFEGKEVEICAICNKEYPVDFLYAGHIKPRANCSDEERVDLENIVMPTCLFGCDILYEKGYIVVEDGIIKKNKDVQTHSIMERLDVLSGQNISYWNDSSAKYFIAHKEKHGNIKVKNKLIKC